MRSEKRFNISVLAVAYDEEPFSHFAQFYKCLTDMGIKPSAPLGKPLILEVAARVHHGKRFFIRQVGKKYSRKLFVRQPHVFFYRMYVKRELRFHLGMIF